MSCKVQGQYLSQITTRMQDVIVAVGTHHLCKHTRIFGVGTEVRGEGEEAVSVSCFGELDSIRGSWRAPDSACCCSVFPELGTRPFWGWI